MGNTDSIMIGKNISNQSPNHKQMALDSDQDSKSELSFEQKSECNEENQISDWFGKEYDLPSELTNIIMEYGKGYIIQCCKCDNQDHVDDIDNLKEELEDDKDWVYDMESSYTHNNILCRTCYHRLVCTICYEVCRTDNYHCYDCANIVCIDCDEQCRHLQEHMNEELDWPEYYNSYQ